MPEAEPPAGIEIHVIRTGRDQDTREIWIKYRAVTVRQVGSHYQPCNDLLGWKWAFGPSLAIPIFSDRKGYTRYYGTNKEELFKTFLDSRRKAVQDARSALVGAEQMLVKAEEFIKEVEHG